MKSKRFSRRKFLGNSTLAIGIMAVGCFRPTVSADHAEKLLIALADVVLPSSLNSEERHRFSRQFWVWLEDYEGGVKRRRPREFPREIELAHISPSSPRALYLNQLGELAERSHNEFESLSLERRTTIVKEALEALVIPGSASLPWPAALIGKPENHVALGLMSTYFYSSKGRNLVEQAAVNPFVCESLDGVDEKPS